MIKFFSNSDILIPKLSLALAKFRFESIIFINQKSWVLISKSFIILKFGLIFVKKFSSFSQNISHFGFSLLILSILFNNFLTNETIINLKLGQTHVAEKFIIKFEDVNQSSQKNYESVVGKFSVKNNDGKTDILYPELRIYNQPNIVTSEAYIKTNFFLDKFMTMNYVQNEEYFNIRYQTKPLMLWIWISVILISLGGLTSLFKKKYES